MEMPDEVKAWWLVHRSGGFSVNDRKHLLTLAEGEYCLSKIQDALVTLNPRLYKGGGKGRWNTGPDTCTAHAAQYGGEPSPATGSGERPSAVSCGRRVPGQTASSTVKSALDSTKKESQAWSNSQILTIQSGATANDGGPESVKPRCRTRVQASSMPLVHIGRSRQESRRELSSLASGGGSSKPPVVRGAGAAATVAASPKR